QRYIEQILEPIVLPRRPYLRSFILMQDILRPHTANITRRFYVRDYITLLRHSAMGLDFNLIEHVWDMGRRLCREYPNLQICIKKKF
ncbi:GSCOCG00012432001-RA-CDS, partial [Cotesia congregata]